MDAITGEPQQRDYLQVARQYADSDDRDNRNDSDHRDDTDSGSLPQGDTP
ncbi:hypothetical protein [Cobetia crustatorum]|nr:hypothetical protein [Cobetia crustatorum]